MLVHAATRVAAIRAYPRAAGSRLAARRVSWGAMVRRALLITGGLLATWIVVLIVLGYALGSRQERATRERLASSLEATVTIGDVDLALVRGRLALDKLAIRRDDAVGHLAIDVSSVRCSLAPLGLALFDRDCRELAVRDVTLEVSAAGLFKLQRPPRSAPIRTDRVVIDNASFVFLPNAFAPSLGRIEIAIEHAVAGSTVLRTPLSWLFSLSELRARFELPAGISLHIAYAGGTLSASGSWLGSTPVALPIDIPLASTAKDAHDELQLLLALGRQIAERLVAKRASDWIKSKLAP